MLLAFENVNFMEVIAGNDSSIGVPPIAHGAIKNFPLAIKLAREVLCDTMMQGYLAAYHCANEVDVAEISERGGAGCDVVSTTDVMQSDSYYVHPFNNELHAAGMELLKLAIIKQSSYIA